MALQARATPTGEEPELLVEAREDLDRRHEHRPRGRQFDRQWDPVQTGADVLDCCGCVVIEHEAPSRLFGAGDEQRAGLRRQTDVTSAVGHPQRRQRSEVLARNSERLPAGREH